MRQAIYTLSMITACLLFNHTGFSQDATEVTEALTTTWYAHYIGQPDGTKMNPTERKESWTFNEDGSMHLKNGRMNMEFDGTWEYLDETNSIRAVLKIMDNEEMAEFPILRITKDTLVMVNPGSYAIQYTTSPPDPNIKAKTAPLVVNSVSTIEVDEWTGLHPFNHKVIISADDSIEKVESVGVVVLLIINGRKTLRLNDDGVTTDIEVSGESVIAGQKHFGFVTDDPELAGEVVFDSEGNFYVYWDKNRSTVEYINE